MSFNGEHLVDMCEERGAEDGSKAAPYSPPIIEECDEKAHAAYVSAYWEVFIRRTFPIEIASDRTAVRRARMIAINRMRRGTLEL